MAEGFATAAIRMRGQSGLPLERADGIPVLPPMTPARRVQLRLKRLFDILASLFALIALAPLLALLALAIRRTGPGPVLLRQRRAGLDGRPFTLYKFRSMQAGCAEDGRMQVGPDDPRITPLGRVLRRRSLDELPQLVNVLRGEMSLVGPRPHVFGMRAAGRPYEELVPYYALRLTMLPGLTGWAQANGLRGPTGEAGPARARIDHDLAYIQNFSLLLDLRILVMTLWRELRGGTGS